MSVTDQDMNVSSQALAELWELTGKLEQAGADRSLILAGYASAIADLIGEAWGPGIAGRWFRQQGNLVDRIDAKVAH